MKARRLALAALVLGFLAAAWFTRGRLLDGAAEPPSFQGYVEAEYVKAAALQSGLLTALHVRRGDFVEAGAPLFEQDDRGARAERDEAAARLAQAEHLLANLEKGGRQSEIETAEAEMREARAARDMAQSDLERAQELFRQRVIARQRLDEAVSAARQAGARLSQAGARLATVRAAGRVDEIRAQRAATAAARATLGEAEWRLSQRRAEAPTHALVADTLFRPGEHVDAGQPVVSLLPPENLLVRFFAPEPLLSRLRVGLTVAVACDGCPPGLTAEVSFIAPETEFTPPVIFSEETRQKLVVMAEARPAQGRLTSLKPGQPVTVRLVE